MNRRGFIFTSDAILALILSMFLLVSTYSTLDRITNLESHSGPMKRIARDTLATMEETGMLARAVQQGRSDELKAILNGLPKSTCAEVALYSESNTIIIAAEKTACDCTNATKVIAAQRSFVAIRSHMQVEGRAVIHACPIGSTDQG